MNRRRLVEWTVWAAAVALGALGIVHDAMNLPSLSRATARGEIAQRLFPQLAANVTFAGLALSFLGVLLALIARDLGKGNRTAWRIGVAIGVYLVVCSLAGYLWLPSAGVLGFSALGAAVCAPLLAWRKDFPVE